MSMQPSAQTTSTAATAAKMGTAGENAGGGGAGGGAEGGGEATRVSVTASIVCTAAPVEVASCAGVIALIVCCSASLCASL